MNSTNTSRRKGRIIRLRKRPRCERGRWTLAFWTRPKGPTHAATLATEDRHDATKHTPRLEKRVAKRKKKKNKNKKPIEKEYEKVTRARLCEATCERQNCTMDFSFLAPPIKPPRMRPPRPSATQAHPQDK